MEDPRIAAVGVCGICGEFGGEVLVCWSGSFWYDGLVNVGANGGHEMKVLQMIGCCRTT